MILEIVVAVIAGLIWGYRKGEFTPQPFVLVGCIAFGLTLLTYLGAQTMSPFGVPWPAAVGMFLRMVVSFGLAFAIGVGLKRLRIARDREDGQ